MNELNQLNNILNEFLLSVGILAPIFSSIFIILEGIFAFLPLFIFITVNILTLGPIIGGIVSWFFTVIGSFLAFYLCRKGISKLFQKKIQNKKNLSKVMTIIDNLKFKQLVLIIGIPFAPSFFVNLAAGLSNISIKKYFYSLMIGKIIIVLFWGYLGTNIIECLTNPMKLIEVILMLIGAYVVAQIINKKFGLDERF